MTTSLPGVPNFGTAPTITTLQFTELDQIGRGQGQNSEVFLVHDRQLDTQLAMKRVPKSKLPPTYFNEARWLYYARHRHVVEIKYASEDAQHVYLAMPYYRGGTLQKVIEGRYLSTREVIRYAIEFLSGLHHVHVRRLIHFDVKPTNVLLDDSDTAALADFGLSREMGNDGSVLMWNGYRPHLPPEFTPSSRKVSRAADIYQAGVTLYRMCVGHSDFERQVAQHGFVDGKEGAAIANGSFPERQRFLAHTPDRLRRIIRKALSVDPSKRFKTVLELMNALAVVDESLDWRYQEGSNWGQGVWSESGSGSHRQVSLVGRTPGWDVHACWITPGGKERRFNKFCATGMPEADARSMLDMALTETWHK